MDQYFVIGPDGSEYGPVDLPGLTQWVREGRVLAQTKIRKAGAEPAAAASLPELAPLFAAPPAAAAPPGPPIATTVALPAEFRAWDFITQAWELVKPHWLPLGAMFFITTAIGAVPYLGGCVMLIIGGAIYVGINRSILAMLAGKTPEIGDMFNGFDRLVQALLAHLVMAVAIGLAMAVCVLPGLILGAVLGTVGFRIGIALGLIVAAVPAVMLGLMWIFISLILAETQLDFWPALQASAAMTSGYRWNLFFLMLANIVVAILGILACCVGIFIAQPVMFTSIALAYRFIQAHPIAKPGTV